MLLPLPHQRQQETIGQRTEEGCGHQVVLPVAGTVRNKNPDIEQIEGADALTGEKDGKAGRANIHNQPEIAPCLPDGTLGDADQEAQEDDKIGAKQPKIVGAINLVIVSGTTEANIGCGKYPYRKTNQSRLKLRIAPQVTCY